MRPLAASSSRTALTTALLAACAWAQVEASAPRKEPAAAVVWLHMNDFHGQFRPLEPLWRERRAGSGETKVGGAGALAGFVKRERDQAAKGNTRVVVTDAGDWFQGTLEGNDSKGRLAVDFLSRLALDAAVLGNHEYDYGDTNLRSLLERARFPVLGANIRVAGSPDTVVGYVRPFHVLDLHGLRVAIVGLIAADTKKVSGGPFGEAEFLGEREAVASTLPEARKAADVVVLLTHCGLETDKRLAEAFPEIPLILGGHSHTALQQPFVVGRTWIVQTQGKATSLYRLQAIAHRGEKRLELAGSELVELALDRHAEDADTARWIGEQTADLIAKWDQVVGELVTPMVDTLATHSSAAGNFVCDVMREVAAADLAFSNKGGIRTRLRPGPLTRRDLYELLPFDNTLASVALPGSRIRELLQAAMAPGKKLPDIGGGTYGYELVDGKRVLRFVTCGGAPLQDDRTYRIAAPSFLVDGNDSFAILATGTGRQDHGVLVRDAVIARVARDGRVESDTGQRIVCVDPAK